MRAPEEDGKSQRATVHSGEQRGARHETLL
jgi:hypothetical protein